VIYSKALKKNSNNVIDSIGFTRVLIVNTLINVGGYKKALVYNMRKRFYFLERYKGLVIIKVSKKGRNNTYNENLEEPPLRYI
jgi:hypothetical protein